MSISDLDPLAPSDNAPVGEGAAAIREVKDAVKEAFPAVDGEIQNAAGGQPTASEYTALFTAVANLEAGVGVGTVPPGAIVMWGAGAVPSGWTICDGSGSANGVTVPDLRDRFILSSGAIFNVDETGGSITTSEGGDGQGTGTISIPDHTITIDNLPEHRHQVFSTAEPNNSGGFPGPSSPLSSGNSAAYAAQGGNSDRAYVMDSDSATDASIGRTSAVGNTNPLVLTHGDGDQEITIDNIAHTHEATPPYYVLAFIIFVGTAAP